MRSVFRIWTICYVPKGGAKELWGLPEFVRVDKTVNRVGSRCDRNPQLNL